MIALFLKNTNFNNLEIYSLKFKKVKATLEGLNLLFEKINLERGSARQWILLAETLKNLKVKNHNEIFILKNNCINTLKRRKIGLSERM